MPIRYQAIIWSNAYYEQTSVKFDAKNYFEKEMHYEMSSAKCPPFYVSLNVVICLLL